MSVQPIDTASLILDDDLRAAKLDPSIPQRIAATPDRHVWVRASAGSGKTKVLVDRLLRLLLPDQKTGADGVAPDKILCLTFTKAGAAEMALRLQKKLLHWSAMQDDALAEELSKLVGGEVPETYPAAARRLLAKLLDAPQRLRILTIHSFCQSVLGRFPVETGLSPDFTVIEESESSAFLSRALNDALERAIAETDSDLGSAFARLALSKNLDQLQIDIRRILAEPVKLQDYMGDITPRDDLRDKIAAAFHVHPVTDFDERGFCRDSNIPRGNVKQLADMLVAAGKSDGERGTVIHDWLSGTDAERLRTLDVYIAQGLSKARTKLKDDPDYHHLHDMELARYQKTLLVGNIEATADLLFIAHTIHTGYTRHKKLMGVLDYADLIFLTRKLLSGEIVARTTGLPVSAEWVLYKLDEGIDHILVDESQDTNPDQWDIVRHLSMEYFAGAAKETDRARTLFVVGDEKQSIFSFQRADPAEFYRMRDYFAEKVTPLQEGFEESLFFSFRSTAPVLRVTDAVFDAPALQAHIGVTSGRLRHISFRSERKTPKEVHGSVELWPLVAPPPKESPPKGWQLPIRSDTGAVSPAQRLAQRIAMRISAMIAGGQAKAGDIMILMRSRSALMIHIIRELKRLNIPVSGLDRLVLNESLIVRDIFAACDFALLPEDSFSLACVLKSPFIGMDEDTLMRLSANRGKNNLWDVIRNDPACADITAWLQRLIDRVGTSQPYEFLDDMMTQPCPADNTGSGWRACQARLGSDALDPVDELLALSLRLELQDIRTLQELVTAERGTHREIKREMEEAADEVRIMTVHASKGLEAPIVILPDTMGVPNKSKLDPFIWPTKSGLPAPLWCDSSGNRSEIYKHALDRLYDLQLEEHSRLLYVALTRAGERLIVCGAGENPKPASWYQLVADGYTRLKDRPEYQEKDDGTRIYSITPDWPSFEKNDTHQDVSLPAWIRAKAPEEPDALKAFSPSQTDEVASDERVYSPLDDAGTNHFKRGIATHKLLQILPDLPPARREAAARHYVARPGLHLDPELQNSIVTETMRVLNDSIFAPVFGEGSLAEVPVTGDMGNGKLINGQIDRLIVRDHDILIVDFKTNRPSPTEAVSIPASYRAQMAAYAAALRHIYPEKAIKCALLWTDQPLLMAIEI